jgi:hypothetical protein
METLAISLLVGGVIAWLTRLYFVRRTERTKIFNEYMRITENDSNNLCALYRSGAMRLGKRGFEKLVQELVESNRPPEISLDTSPLSLYHTLRLAAKCHNGEFASDNELESWLLRRMAEQEEKGLPSDAKSALKAAAREKQNHS